MMLHPFSRLQRCSLHRALLVAVATLAFSPVRTGAQTVPTTVQPLEAFAAGTSAPPALASSAVAEIQPNSVIYRSIKYAGKFHLLALHFPIAFLLAAMIVQWHVVATGRGGDVVSILLWFGAIGAVVAAALGWMYAYDSVYFGDDENILFWHRWLGTGTAVLATSILVLRNRLGPRSLGLALTLCAGLVGAAAHFGGSLVNGADFLKKF